MTDEEREPPATDEQTGRGRVRLRVDAQDMVTRYANAFRSNASADEVMIDFGVNSAAPGGDEGEVRFEITNRTIMNYYTTKRLAMLLGNLVRRHEERFGELKLNAADREKPRDGE